MNEIDSIVIYNNEIGSSQYESDRVRYLITLRAENQSVEFENLLHEKQARKLVNYSKFDELFSYASSLILDEPERWEGYHRRFKDLNAYHKWRNKIKLVEEDILWRINIHYTDGSFETAIFKDVKPVSRYLPRLENQVKRVLGMRHDRDYGW